MPHLSPCRSPVVHPLCPSDTEIFPGNGHCYRLVAEKAAWLQAQEQCRAWAGAALAMVDSPAIQHFLVSRVTRYLNPALRGWEVGVARLNTVVGTEPETVRRTGESGWRGLGTSRG